jgi:hypothetical protein
MDIFDDPHEQPSLNEILRALPLLDEVFLGMQAMNVDLVDGFLEELESQLLQEFMANDRPPIPSMMFLSAISQMWVFAAYELLRTWRQRVREITQWGKRLEALAGEEREVAMSAKRTEIEARAAETRDPEVRWQVFERAAEPRFVEELRSAMNRTEVTFHDFEALRMTLAKHEVPRQDGMFAGAPGYGRVDMLDGSFSWQIELGRNEVTVLSRRNLADALRALAEPNERILPAEIQAKVADLEREGYGLNRVVAILDNGTEVPGVRVLWATEVVGVDGEEQISFDTARVVDVRPDPTPEREPDETDVRATQEPAQHTRPAATRRAYEGRGSHVRARTEADRQVEP